MDVSRPKGLLPRAITRDRPERSRREVLGDTALAIVAGAFGLADLATDWGDNGTTFTTTSALVIVAACAALVFRRQQPASVLIVVWVARLVIALDVNTEVALSIPAAIALYTFARRSTRERSLAAAIGASTVAVCVVLIVAPTELAEELVIEVLFALLVSALAEVVRSHEERTNELVRNAATEQRQAERLRLAHDLHDGIAHSLSNIAVQSGVAARLIDSNPEHAKKALDIINQAGRESLDELRAFLGLLRSDDDVLVATTQTVAEPGDIHDAIADAVANGVDVRTTQFGEFPAQTSPEVVRTMTRIIEESLTNVHRHAGVVPTVVDIRHHADRVELRIVNEAGKPGRVAVPSTGVGIIGMTERAEAIGGSLSASAIDGGGFEVRASLPYSTTESTAE